MRPRTIRTALLLALAWSAPAAAGPGDPEAPPPTPAAIDGAIERGVAWLLEEQDPSGTWGRGDDALGPTALACYALLHAGLDEAGPRKDARRLALALRSLDRNGPAREGARERDPGTYATSLLLLVLRERGRPEDRARMRGLVDLLARTQADNGQWSYSGRPGDSGRAGPPVGDNSNTQFAVLALGAANGAGVPVPRATLERARSWWRSCPQADGGFGYSSGGATASESSGSMTCAGIASLAVLDAALGETSGEPVRAGALRRLSKDLSVDSNFGPSPSGAAERRRASGRGWLHYYLWSLERAMVLAGTETLGGRDWYGEGVRRLLASQYDDGSWRGESPLYATCFALLFLTRAADPPRAFTRPPSDAPVTGTPADAAENGPRPAGTVIDWLRRPLGPGDLRDACAAEGPSSLLDLTHALSDPDAGVRRRAFEALVALLPSDLVDGADRHPLRRGRLAGWLRRNLRFLALRDGRFALLP